MTRKAMQSTLRKVEEERAEFGKRAAQMSDEVQKIKKQVARINQPVFGRVVIDWGNLIKKLIILCF